MKVGDFYKHGGVTVPTLVTGNSRMTINLARVRNQLESRRNDLIARRNRIRRDLQREAGPLSADAAEQAVEVQNDETLALIERSAQIEIEDIEQALQRLAEGEYGTCKVCGREIGTARLLASPQSVRCVNCADAPYVD
jgi:RNA polymerase-binding protein DksA